MVPLLLLWAACMGAPFEDTQHRFHLELPKGWQFTPQPGDMGGATFRRAADGVFVNAMVRVMPFGEELALQTFVERVAQASIGEPGYRQLLAEPVQVAGLPGFHRRFLSLVNGDTHLPKMVDQRLLVHAGVGYVVHAETLADAFPLFEADVHTLMHSFGLGPANNQAASPHRHPHLEDLQGSWKDATGSHKLELSPGGTITLNNAHGTYHVDQGTLVADMQGETKIFGVDFAGSRLVLTGGVFGDGATFARQGEAPGAQAVSPAAPAKAAGPRGKAKHKSKAGKASQPAKVVHPKPAPPQAPAGDADWDAVP